MTEQEIELIERWIVQNVSADYVPGDEGNTEGLIYNLIALLREWPEDKARYRYTAEHNAVVMELYRKYWLDEGGANRE